jgi:outer membrane protein assembly factor BamA
VKAQVTLEEYPEWSFRYGLQLEGERNPAIEEFNAERNAGVVAELKNPNLLGRALTGGVFGMYQFDRRDASVFLATSRLFGWPARTTLFGFFARDRERDEAGEEILYIQDRKGASLDQRWRVRGIQIVYGYRFERRRTFDPEPGPNDPVDLDFVDNLAKLSTAALFDWRDDPLDTRKGTFSSASFDQAALWLGSDVSNRKLLLQQYAFAPVSQVVFAWRGQFGRAFGTVDQFFDSDRFRAGGGTTVRGYSEEALGPRDENGVATGGQTLVILNQEMRFPMYRWLRGVAFVDAGNIFGIDASGVETKFSWKELKIGYGAGVRVTTPVGVLRVDFGLAKSALPGSTRKPNSLRDGRFYFGIGHIF